MTSTAPIAPVVVPAPPRRRRESAVVLVLAAAVGGVVAWRTGMFLDLHVYRMGADAALGGDLYRVRFPTASLPFTYPPFPALLMLPLGWLAWPLAAAVWTAASVGSLLVALRVTIDHLGPDAHRVLADRRTLGLLVVAAIAAQPVWSTLSFGQVNLMLMALVLLDVLGPQHRFSGWLVGLAAGIKLTPLFLLAFLVAVGRRRAAAVAAGSFAATALLALAVAPRESVTYWTTTLFDSSRIGATEFAGNQSLNGLLARLLGHDAPTWLWVACATPVALVALLAARRLWATGRDVDRLLGLSSAALAMVLCSPISWDHHWVWLVPLALGVLASGRPGARGVALALGLVLASRAIWWAPFRDGRELHWDALEQVSGNAYVWTGLAMIGLLTWWSRPRTGPGAAPGITLRQAR